MCKYILLIIICIYSCKSTKSKKNIENYNNEITSEAPKLIDTIVTVVPSVTKFANEKGEVIILTDANFQQAVNTDKITVVDFWATWCGPCRAVAPIIKELAKDYKDKVNIAKLDVDENPEIAKQLNVSAIPVMYFFKNGKIVDRVLGAKPKANYVRIIEKLLKG